MTIRRRNHGRGHSYYVDGVKFPGVTTLIGDGLPKRALVGWAARSVAEHVADNLDAINAMRPLGRDAIVDALKGLPYAARNTAAARGTDVHVLARALADGLEVDVPDELAGHVDACVDFLDEWHVRPVITEATVANRAYRYAGTLDAVADMRDPFLGDVRAIFDYKTSSGVYSDAAFQLAAYRHAEVYVDTNDVECDMESLGITCGYVVWLRADGYDVVPVECGPDVFADFLHIAAVARAARAADNLIGTIAHV